MDKSKIIQEIVNHYMLLSPECMHELSECSKILILNKEEQIVKEGQYSDKTFYIAKGSARAFYLKDGKDISDWFAFENEFISSINSFFLNLPSPHFIETIEPTVLLEIGKVEIDRLSDKYLEFDRLGKLVVTKTMLKLQNRISSLQFETARQRYDNLLNIRPDIIQRVPLTHIASYLGITLETLSRNRRKRI